MTAKTCGNCKHAVIPPPRMSKHKAPRLLEEYPGSCAYPAVKLPMVSSASDYRPAIWAKSDARWLREALQQADLNDPPEVTR